MGWFDTSSGLANSAATAASVQMLASIDLFVYIRALRRPHVEQLIGDTEVGRLATVALSHCLIEHAWHDETHGAMLAPRHLRRALGGSWAIFDGKTRARLDDTFCEVAQRRLAPPSRLILAQLEHWCEGAVGKHFAEAKPVRTGWLTYALGHATKDSAMASYALADFPIAA